MSEKQLRWLVKALTFEENGWSVVFMSHSFLFETEEYPKEVSNGKLAWEIICSFKNKLKGNLKSDEMHYEAEVSYDFTDNKSNDVLTYLFGHIHKDLNFVCDGITAVSFKNLLKVCGEVKDRASEVEAFQNDAECMVFVGQLQTVSMGLTLTASSTLVFYSLSYNYADYSQARARIHRIGQRNTCQYIHLVAKDTIDETVLKALEQKENIATKIVDDWRSILK